ncbi:MAG: baeS [Mycobacterium sp.]|jgi:hypothetical protein|nr:baeS [Mycobacterium sp.]
MATEGPEPSARLTTVVRPAFRRERVVGQFRLDLTSRSWWWSPGLWELLGYPSIGDAPTTELLLEHLPESASPSVQEALAETASSGIAFTWSGQARRLDGTSREVTVFGEREDVEDGRPTAVTGFVMDLTLGGAPAADVAWLIVGTSHSADTIREIQHEMLSRDPPEAWPETLCVAINLCVEAEIPACVLWGPNLIQFYNDAYADAIAAGRPCLIGQPSAENWPEIWDTVRPDIRSVFTTGAALTKTSQSLSILRNNRLTECFFDYSITPLRARDGSIGGVFCVVLDSTVDRIAGRRSVLRRDLGELCSSEASAEQSLPAAMSVLASDPKDVPFAAVYSVDVRLRSAIRRAGYGLDPESWVCCERWEFPQPSPWPFETAVEAGTIVLDDLSRLHPNVTAGPWPEPVQQAVLAALRSGESRPTTDVLIVGLSPRLLFDKAYREFVGCIAQEVGASLSASRTLAAAEERISQLQVALTSNRHIGAAIGVLMAFRKVSEEQAFDLLRKTSQRTRRKLREVAEDVTRTGALPK